MGILIMVFETFLNQGLLEALGTSAWNQMVFLMSQAQNTALVWGASTP